MKHKGEFNLLGLRQFSIDDLRVKLQMSFLQVSFFLQDEKNLPNKSLDLFFFQNIFIYAE